MPSPRRPGASPSPTGRPHAVGVVAHGAELLAPLGTVRSRRMFGGHGLYVDDLFIAIVADEQLYLKADAETEGRFREAGCHAFVYEAAGRRVALNYWTVPDAALESAAEMLPWGRLAMGAALRARAASSRRPKAARSTPPRQARR